MSDFRHFVFISVSLRFIFLEVRFIFERFDLLEQVSIKIRGSYCFRMFQCIAFGFRVNAVRFCIYFMHFKFMLKVFILFFCVLILIRAFRLRFADLEHIAWVIEYEFFNSYNFDRNGTPYDVVMPRPLRIISTSPSSFPKLIIPVIVT